METTAKKGIPYKSDANRQSTHILVRLTESQKETIRNNATKNNQTISEYFRTLAIKATSKK
jgi:membrane-bound lytic murein transglycosylase